MTVAIHSFFLSAMNRTQIMTVILSDTNDKLFISQNHKNLVSLWNLKAPLRSLLCLTNVFFDLLLPVCLPFEAHLYSTEWQSSFVYDSSLPPILKNLHWLPVEARINFKILLITYKILHGQSTNYLEPIIQEYHPSRTLRSSTFSLLCIPSIKCNSYGGCAFSAAAPELNSRIY